MKAIAEHIIKEKQLGELSAKYESNGDPGAVANTKGDKGGPSYGMYQLALNTGSLEAYIKASRFRPCFIGLKPGTEDFDKKWKKLAAARTKDFAEEQYNFHMGVYYTPVRTMCDKWGIPDTNAINQVIWSTSTQHGPSWTKKAFKGLAGKAEHEIIESIYKLRGAQFMNSVYYNSSEAARNVRKNVLNRYKQELTEALQLIT